SIFQQLLLIFVIITSTFAHMFYILNRLPKTNAVSAHRIRRSLVSLFIQIAVPLLLLLLPGCILFVSIICLCIPF
ncbi:hypothetical protein PFISCL1PPCAC_17205, partial [Pristionchus fissidentatus]